VTYTVREIYYTLQGEGAQTGRAAVFCRFAGCNLWSGREEDRASAVCRFCDTDFVGADGPGGGKFEGPAALAEAVARAWSGGQGDGTPGAVVGPGEVGGGPSEGRTERDAAGGPAAHEPRAPPAGPGPGGAGVSPPPVRGTPGRPLVVCTGGEPLLQLDEALVAAFHARGFAVAVETNGTRPAPAGLDWVCVSPKAGAPLVLTTGDELKLVYPQAGAPPEAFEALGLMGFWFPLLAGHRVRHPWTTGRVVRPGATVRVQPRMAGAHAVARLPPGHVRIARGDGHYRQPPEDSRAERVRGPGYRSPRPQAIFAGGSGPETGREAERERRSRHRPCGGAGRVVDIFHGFRVAFLKGVGQAPDFADPAPWRPIPQRGLAARIPQVALFDALVVDEGQDFEAEWLEVLRLFLKHDADALWLEDPDQNLQGKPPVALAGFVGYRCLADYRPPESIARSVRKSPAVRCRAGRRCAWTGWRAPTPL
jgi:organic radical activating enzyme